MENHHGRRSSFYWACIGCNRTWNLRDGKLNPSFLAGTVGPTPRHVALQHLIHDLGFTRDEALEFVNEFGVVAVTDMMRPKVA